MPCHFYSVDWNTHHIITYTTLFGELAMIKMQLVVQFQIMILCINNGREALWFPQEHGGTVCSPDLCNVCCFATLGVEFLTVYGSHLFLNIWQESAIIIWIASSVNRTSFAGIFWPWGRFILNHNILVTKAVLVCNTRFAFLLGIMQINSYPLVSQRKVTISYFLSFTAHRVHGE